MRTTGFVSCLFALGAVASACSNGDRESDRGEAREPRPAIATLPVRDYNGFGPPPFHAVQSGNDFASACSGISTRAQIDDYCWPIQMAGVFPSMQMDGTYQCYCSGGTDSCGNAGCNNPAPACKCPGNKVCGLTGGCTDGDAGLDASLPPQDAGDAGCDPTPTNANTSAVPIRASLGYDFPGAVTVCSQLVAIPFVGPALFSPTGGLGFSVDVSYDQSKTWSSVCREEDKSTFGAGISANICGLVGEGRWNKTTTDLAAHCVNCDPAPGSCGAVACTDHSDSQTRQVSVTRRFDFPLGGSSSDECSIGGAPSKGWLDWVKQHLNLSASVGGGWNGNTAAMNRAGPGGCLDCTACETKNERNSIFLQASARASISTPTWAGVSGSAYGELTGRAGIGRVDERSTCAAPPSTCGGTEANASVSLRLGVTVGAFGYSTGASVGYTCRWSTSWSTCSSSPPDYAECGWSRPTDP